MRLIHFKKFHASFIPTDIVAEPTAATLFRKFRGSAKTHPYFAKKWQPYTNTPGQWIDATINFKTKKLLTRHRKLLAAYLHFRPVRQHRITRKIASFLVAKHTKGFLYFDLLLINFIVLSRLCLHHTQAAGLISNGFVYLNGVRVVNQRHLVCAGDVVQIIFSQIYLESYAYYYNFCTKYYYKYLNKFFKKRSKDPEYSFRRTFMRPTSSVKKSRRFTVFKNNVPK